MPTQADLISLLTSPNESLTLEYKSWLDLGCNRDKATLAKAAIALANEGGGIITLGMRTPAVNAPLASLPLPEGWPRYNQDAVNAAINRYADPALHCELVFAQHPETHVEHAFVVVPGGMIVPVMSARGQDGEIQAQRCYVRKPGPPSEEPFTAEEWRGVFERCLKARREAMLDAIRVIVQGHPAAGPATQHEALDRFSEEAQRRWLHHIQPLPANDPACMALGFYRLSFQIMNVAQARDFGELRNRLAEARRIRHTGWSPFVALTRPDLAPRIVDDAIEVWLGDPGPERDGGRSTDNCDFWRATRSGLLFLQRGFDEDDSNRVQAGSALDAILPIWRVAEPLLYVSRLARLFDQNPVIYISLLYSGLHGRELVSLNNSVIIHEGHICHDNEVTLDTEATAAEMDDNLVEVVHSLLLPLYERFDFFELPLDLVRREIDRMRRQRF